MAYMKRYDKKEKKMIFIEVWDFGSFYEPDVSEDHEHSLKNAKKGFKKAYIEKQGSEEGFKEIWNTRDDSKSDFFDRPTMHIRITIPYDTAMIKVLHPKK
jgi:hypothetical protein